MNNVTFNKKGTIKYLVWTFLIAWFMQVVTAVLYRNGIVFSLAVAYRDHDVCAAGWSAPLWTVAFGHGMETLSQGEDQVTSCGMVSPRVIDRNGCGFVFYCLSGAL